MVCLSFLKGNLSRSNTRIWTHISETVLHLLAIRDVHCAFLRSVFALFLRVQIRPILRCFALRIRNFAHFALFCALLRSAKISHFALFCAFLRSAKILHFALFCAFSLHKNFAFCAVLRIFPAQKFRILRCFARFSELKRLLLQFSATEKVKGYRRGLIKKYFTSS